MVRKIWFIPVKFEVLLILVLSLAGLLLFGGTIYAAVIYHLSFFLTLLLILLSMGLGGLVLLVILLLALGVPNPFVAGQNLACAVWIKDFFVKNDLTIHWGKELTPETLTEEFSKDWLETVLIPTAARVLHPTKIFLEKGVIDGENIRKYAELPKDERDDIMDRLRSCRIYGYRFFLTARVLIVYGSDKRIDQEVIYDQVDAIIGKCPETVAMPVSLSGGEAEVYVVNLTHIRSLYTKVGLPYKTEADTKSSKNSEKEIDILSNTRKMVYNAMTFAAFLPVIWNRATQEITDAQIGEQYNTVLKLERRKNLVLENTIGRLETEVSDLRSQVDTARGAARTKHYQEQPQAEEEYQKQWRPPTILRYPKTGLSVVWLLLLMGFASLAWYIWENYHKLFWPLLLVFSALVIIVGIIIWWRRRRKQAKEATTPA